MAELCIPKCEKPKTKTIKVDNKNITISSSIDSFKDYTDTRFKNQSALISENKNNITKLAECMDEFKEEIEEEIAEDYIELNNAIVDSNDEIKELIIKNKVQKYTFSMVSFIEFILILLLFIFK